MPESASRGRGELPVSGGVPASRGVGASRRGVRFPGGSPASQGGHLLPRGCVFPGGCLLPGGGRSASRGGSIPVCTEADPPVNRITDTSKNITLATTSLRPVMTEQCI